MATASDRGVLRDLVPESHLVFPQVLEHDPRIRTHALVGLDLHRLHLHLYLNRRLHVFGRGAKLVRPVPGAVRRLRRDLLLLVDALQRVAEITSLFRCVV